MRTERTLKEEILDCGHSSMPTEFTPGYGIDKQGKRICYKCCGEMDKETMIKTGKITLYLCQDGVNGSKVSNWPDSLSFKVSYLKKGRHNIARTRYDFWFTGPDGKQWHGVNYGENSMLANCKRIKS